MLRIFVIFAAMLFTQADQPVRGVTSPTCEPYPVGGIRIDLGTKPPLRLLLVPMPARVIKLHQPLKVYPCTEAGCDMTNAGGQGTITLDDFWRGSYEVIRQDGTKQAGTFVAVPLRKPIKCL